jgi:hypothetical protein
MKREVRALVFDQYGTIVDMQGGLVAAVTPFLKRSARAGRASRTALLPGGGAPISRTR